MKSFDVMIVLLLTLGVAAAVPVKTLTPVIGILGVPAAEAGCDVLFAPDSGVRGGNNGSSCFTSFYVKWIEQGGGRVVPIPFDAYDRGLVAGLFKQLNGLLFTGGGLSLGLNSPFVRTAQEFFRLATSDANDYFPIHGTCMGFQLLHVLVAQDVSVLSGGFDAENIAWPLTFAPGAESSPYFGWMPSEVRDILRTKNVTMNFHHDGVTPSMYSVTPALSNFFNILSTNEDRHGRVFVSTVEAKNWPIVGTQWHPERPIFEFNSYDQLPHSFEAIYANQMAGNYFVDQCRRSPHVPSAQMQMDQTIYNYDAVYQHDGSTQFYYF